MWYLSLLVPGARAHSCLSVLLDEPMGPWHTGVSSGLSSTLPQLVAWALFSEARCPHLQHAGTTQQARELGANETLAPKLCCEQRSACHPRACTASPSAFLAW